ncbi:transcriptional regulator family: Fungal Specific TF [Trichoderma harzianum]|nr:transcriptional regulator family: Fungal Specific TF [Trichoderma harzianum]
MEYIGSFYRHNPIGAELFPGNDASIETDGFVQNALLRAMAKSMCDDKSGAEVFLARAIQQASFIGMHEKSFADTVADNDPILAESWRRTWWMLYLTDANFSVTRRDFDIPLQAATLLDYRSREFALDDKPFSSFAYLIDATEIFIAALRASTQYQDIIEAESLCGDLEARIISWFLMLPLNKRELTVTPGLMDQLMFQSHMMMYTSLAFIHRPLSNLRYDPAEDISTCGPPPPPLEQNSGYTRIAHGVHSEKLFQAIRKQTQCLILLPMRAAQLSPFVICMIACSTIAYLVASKLALKADEAEAARSRIRISLATLRMDEDAWPRAKKILMELKRIAQAILQSATVSPTPSIDSQLLTDETTVTASFFDNEWLCAFENTTS